MQASDLHQWARATPSLRMRRGLMGEAFALHHLETQGYSFRAHRYRTPTGEVDLVMEGKDGWVFVEVKTRGGTCFGTPQEALTPLKLHRLLQVANHYRTRYNCRGPWRIDLVAVQLDRHDRLVHLDHLSDVTL